MGKSVPLTKIGEEKADIPDQDECHHDPSDELEMLANEDSLVEEEDA